MDTTFSKNLEQSGEYGTVVQLHPPIAILVGLPSAHLHEIVVFETGQIGEIFVLEKEQVQVLIFSSDPLSVGVKATRTNKFLTVPVGEQTLGSAIDPIGNPISQQMPYSASEKENEIDIAPLGLSFRKKITRPFLTGVSLIDMMIPLGKGQKELIIGDRKTGKTSFLLNTIKNQVLQGSVVVYAAIAKNKSDIKKVIEFLKAEKLDKQTVVVATSSYNSPSLIYLTPYSAMTIAEYFRDQGRDVLVVLDDLSTHAKFYREISLMAKRFPGRESYPGDIFYIHARLLERAGNYLINGKETSVTVLPVAELIEGDFTGYVATNLMSMTDGHIYFDSNIYYKGRRPAINISLSVTRVGRQAQSSLVRSINRELTAFLALYDKMGNLSHFGAELTDTVKQILSTGENVYDFFEQSMSTIIPLNIQLVLFAMIWLKMFERVDKYSIASYRDTFIKAFQDKAVEAFFEQIVKAENFNQLLANVAKNKDKLLSICKINSRLNQK